ncbi:MAG: PHP domain-containing protein, partial [Vicinamibacterales bacterium]
MSYSRYFLCDLQVHTSADRQHRYGNVGGPKPDANFARDLIARHAAAGVGVLAVTDHNRVDWYPLLRDAGEAAGVYVFPGVEVSVNGCHLLAIWDRTDDAIDLARRFLLHVFAPGESPVLPSGDPRPVTRGQVLEIAAAAADHQALVFAPHATAKKNGLFGTGVCRNSSEVAQSDLLTGFDVFGNRLAD